MREEFTAGEKRSRAVFLTALSMVFTLMVWLINVKPVGPRESSVGLAFLNEPVFKALGVSAKWYGLSEVLGYLALALAGMMGVIGLIQLIHRRKLLKVDPEILSLGILYGVTLLLYILFDKIAINYRPLVVDGLLESSYPSSHTMLSLVVFGSGLWMLKRYFYPGKLQRVLMICAGALLVLTVLARLLSGYHWLTDIIGGILMATMLLAWFDVVLFQLKTWRREQKRV